MAPFTELRARVPGGASLHHRSLDPTNDGCCGGPGDQPVVLCELDASFRRGALSPADGATLEHAARTALAQRLPLVVLVASSGADVHEGLDALVGWGRAARALVECSGIVPLLFGVVGPAVSGPALLLGLADQVVMTEDAYAFVSGPRMVRAYTGVPIGNEALGGSGAHGRSSGVASLIVPDRDRVLASLGELLALLPPHADELPPVAADDDPVDRLSPDAADLLPSTTNGSYDVRDVLRSVVDHGDLLELRGRWAGNLVTAMATIGGQPVGVVANQPMTLAGTLDIAASQKGARFVAFCDAFNMPLVTFVDTPGFFPGKDVEWRGMIRHGAQLAFAFARATVPRVSVTLRKSYGGAYIVMDSKRMGCDVALAWPTAEIAVMGAKGAVEILHRAEHDPARRLTLEQEYEERLLNPYVAASRGLIDAVIDPADTRREVAAALAVLGSKRERMVTRSHDNSPL